MNENEWVYYNTYDEAEWLVVKSLLEDANISYREKVGSEGEILKLYTSSSGVMGSELWVASDDWEKVKQLLLETD